MNFSRLRKAKLLAKKRFKNRYPDYNPNKAIYRQFSKAMRLGMLRKTNVACSCHMCRNPRHSYFYNKEEKLTVQERKAPKAQDWGY